MAIRRIRKKWLIGSAVILILIQIGFAIDPVWAGFKGITAGSVVSWGALSLTILFLFIAMLSWFFWKFKYGIPRTQPRQEMNIEALRRLEEYYHSFCDNAPVGIFHTNPEGLFLYANAKMAKLFGYASPRDLMDQVQDIGSQLYVNSSERASFYRRIVVEGIVKNVELRFMRLDGEVIWLAISLRVVPETCGGVHHLEGFAVNVTDRKRVEEAQVSSERMLRQMLVWMRDIVYRLDPEGRILFINPAVTRYGFSEEELLGRPILDLVHPDDRERCHRNIVERRTGERRTEGVEFKLACKEPADYGNSPPIMLLEAEGVYEIDSSNSLKFLGTSGRARDITRNKLADAELKHTLETKDLLLRELQHRVKNNNQIILSLISLSRDRVKSSEAATVCREIQGYVSCMAAMHSLLSRATTGDMLNLDDMVKDVFASADTLFGKRKITANFDLENVALHMDRALPCGMIMNELFTNIFKHAFPDDSPGQVRVKLTRLYGDRVMIIVADDGVGFCRQPRTDDGSMGMNLIHLLANQLDAELSLSGDSGVRIKLIFDVAVSSHQLRGRLVPDDLFKGDVNEGELSHSEGCPDGPVLPS